MAEEEEFIISEADLLEEELSTLSVKGEAIDPLGKASLVCSVLTKKFYNKESFKAHFKKLWKSQGGFDIADGGPNLFVIRFNHEEDLIKVYKGSPWFFRGNLVLMKRLTEAMTRQQVSFDTAILWLCLKKIPPGCCKEDLAQKVGSKFEGVHDVDLSKGDCKIKVSVDLRKPMLRCSRIEVEGDVFWIPLTYDNLPSHCVGCGRLGHDLQICTWILEEQRAKPIKEQSYRFNLQSDWSTKGIEVVNDNAGGRVGVTQRSYIAKGIAVQRTKEQEPSQSPPNINNPNLPSQVPDTIISKPANGGNLNMEVERSANEVAAEQSTVKTNKMGDTIIIEEEDVIEDSLKSQRPENHGAINLDSQFPPHHSQLDDLANITNQANNHAYRPRDNCMEIYHKPNEVGHFLNKDPPIPSPTNSGKFKWKRAARSGLIGTSQKQPLHILVTGKKRQNDDKENVQPGVNVESQTAKKTMHAAAVVAEDHPRRAK